MHWNQRPSLAWDGLAECKINMSKNGEKKIDFLSTIFFFFSGAKIFKNSELPKKITEMTVVWELSMPKEEREQNLNKSEIWQKKVITNISDVRYWDRIPKTKLNTARCRYLVVLGPEWTTAWSDRGCWPGSPPAPAAAGCLSRSVDAGQEVSTSNPLSPGKVAQRSAGRTWFANSRWQTVVSWGSFITALMICNMGVMPAGKHTEVNRRRGTAAQLS